jgi:DNA-binding PadR family transcriptional regulator
MIGEFEYLLLAATQRLRNNAYGASISQALEDATGRRCSIGALYTTLDRLEAKGLILTPEGRKAAAEFHTAIKAISKGINWEVAYAR